MIPFDFIQALLPELILCGAAILLLMLGAYLPKEKIATYIMAAAAIALALVFFSYADRYHSDKAAFFGMYYTDAFAVFSKMLITAAAFFALLLSDKWIVEQRKHAAEYPVLLLFATLGLSLVVSADNLLAFYVALELASLSMYVMAAYDRDKLVSSEAGLKYFVLGALASGMMLFGISIIYGFSGTIRFDVLKDVLSVEQAGLNIGVITGVVLVLVAVCFKISAVPFHMWTPDVYEGAPTPVVAFFATAPKVAIICFAIRFLSDILSGITEEWQQVIIFVSIASMVLGSFAGLVQTSLQRLIAYSSIGHIGYVLMGLVAASQAAAESILIYLVIYVIMTLGVFACIVLLRVNDHSVSRLNDLSGLSTTYPKTALCLAILMFSMAGIPPFIGFFAKVFVFKSIIEAGFVWMAVIGVLCSVISCFYYIRIVKIMYFDEQQNAVDGLQKHSMAGYILALSVALNLFIFKPGVLMDTSRIAASALFP